MARLASTAVAGYFPAPARIIPMIAALFDIGKGDVAIVDPCAGDGEAVCLLGSTLAEREGRYNHDLYTCELEKGRQEALLNNISRFGWRTRDRAQHGDAFQIDFGGGDFAGILYLNPPYDLDPVHGRLEQRWLERFASVLVDGGWLVFVVPHHALAASAEFIAREFHSSAVHCFRFPDPEFAAYKQVVLVARKCAKQLAPDPIVVECVQRWSASTEGMPVLGEIHGLERALFWPVEVPGKSWHGQDNTWKLAELDVEGLARKFRPMRRTARNGKLELVAGMLPDMPLVEAMNRRFHVATPARPAHLAAGIAAGLFNGKQVSAKVAGMPDLLVKGTFDREYVRFEEKKNEAGETTAVVEAQQPRLTITILDLSRGRYHTLRPGGVTGAREPAAMTIEDLLDSYGPALARVMAEQCPARFDPARPDDSLALKPIARPLFEAQAHAGSACIGLIRDLGAAILLGEIGVGKTSVAISVANTIARRPLVMCPPHLLDTWRDEVRTLLPDAKFRALRDIGDVDAAAADDSPGIVFSVMSRETAKLGHGYEGVTGPCPGCGAWPAEKPEELARKRRTCTASKRRPLTEVARVATEMAVALTPFIRDAVNVQWILNGRTAAKAQKLPRRAPESWHGFDPRLVSRAFAAAFRKVQELATDARVKRFVMAALIADPVDLEEAVLWLCEHVDKVGYSLRYDISTIAAFLPDEAQPRVTAAYAISSYGPKSRSDVIEAAWLNEDGSDGSKYTVFGRIRYRNGVWSLDEKVAGTLEHAVTLFNSFCNPSGFDEQECGEPLYQAVPSPRRYPLATYIARRCSDAFDIVIIDEAHETQGFDSSAQGIASARLSGMGAPVLRLTGSVMNGYAESLYGTVWLTSPNFRAEFKRDEVQRYLDRYGYRKRMLTDRDKETGDVVEFGSSSDRVVRSERVVGNAPGVLPLFLFRHLLGCSVTLHRSDLKAHVPPCRHLTAKIKAGPELGASFRHMFDTLRAQIKKDQFNERAGQLFGALSEIGSYLDRSSLDTGNRADGSYVVAYPDGEEIARGESFSADTFSSKEEWLFDLLEREFSEGRNVLLFTWHENLLPRLARIVAEEFGIEVPSLVAGKVPTAKRQAWIDREVVSKKARVLVANPATVQTGLNNLVWFATEVFHENPAVNPTMARQAVGRIDRLGQKQESRIYWPMFEGTIQQQMHSLMLRKVAIATAADGLDAESVLIAAGGSDDPYMAGMSLGKQLLAMLEQAELEIPKPTARRRSTTGARLSP